MIVVDASVAVKWLIAEEGAAAARALLAGDELLFVPSLAKVEVSGAVLRKHRAGMLDEDEVRGCIGLWNDLLSETVQVVAFEELIDRAVRIAIACAHPLTDCVYVAAADQLGAALITADAALQARCKKAHAAITLLVTAATPH
ncbi:MAG: type II toxin-antitoxin system VapC family toxin [Phycisphaerales bacterium]|nr:type II toxin-antitoxin system VapC family toxin [Phycisphaerales bacterium]